VKAPPAVSLPPKNRGDVVLIQREVRRRHDRIDLFRAPEADDGPFTAGLRRVQATATAPSSSLFGGTYMAGTLTNPRAQIGVGPGPWAELA